MSEICIISHAEVKLSNIANFVLVASNQCYYYCHIDYIDQLLSLDKCPLSRQNKDFLVIFLQDIDIRETIPEDKDSYKYFFENNRVNARKATFNFINTITTPNINPAIFYSMIIKYYIQKNTHKNNVPLLFYLMITRQYCFAEFLIMQEASINIRHSAYGTPLSYAIKNCSDFLAEKLVLKNANFNDIDVRNSVCYNKPLTLARLIIKGADLNYTDARGNNLLIKAIKLELNDIALCLINYGINIYHINNDGENALVFATASGNISLVRTLLAHGLDPNIKNKNGKPILLTTLEKYYYKTTSLLLDAGAKTSSTDNNGNNILTMAISQRNFKLVYKLVTKYKANLTYNNYGGLPILYFAKRSSSKIKKFITNKINALHRTNKLIQAVLSNETQNAMPLISMYHENNDMLLACACSNNNTVLGHKLIFNGADINSNITGDPVITIAVKRSSQNFIKMLLRFGVNINQRDKDGRTALTWALIKKDTNITNILINNGAECATSDNFGKSNLTIALSAGKYFFDRINQANLAKPLKGFIANNK